MIFSQNLLSWFEHAIVIFLYLLGSPVSILLVLQIKLNLNRPLTIFEKTYPLYSDKAYFKVNEQIIFFNIKDPIYFVY